MPRLVDRLSARTAQTVKRPGMYADGKGLYLRIGPAGSKSWVYRRVAAQPLGVVHVLVAREPAKYRLPQPR